MPNRICALSIRLSFNGLKQAVDDGFPSHFHFCLLSFNQTATQCVIFVIFFFRFLVANFVKNFILLMSWDYKIEFLCFSLTSNKKTKKKKEEKCPLQKQFKYGYYIERPLASSSRKSKKRKKVELEFASQILFSHKFFHSLNKILFEIHFRRYIWFRLLLLLLSSRPSTIKQQTKKKERTFT